MVIFLKIGRLGSCTGISIVDSTPLRVFNNERILTIKFLMEFHRGEKDKFWDGTYDNICVSV